MKKFLIGLTCFALMFSVMAFAPKTEKVVFAADEIVKAETTTAQTSKIEVVGTGEVTVTPDTAIINVAVETSRETASEVESENSEKVNAVINVLLENGVARENIKTTNYYMYKKYDYQNGQNFIGYQLNNSLQFKVSIDSDISSLLSKLTEAGITNVNGINFAVSSRENAYNQALSNALNNARAKASVLANGRELKIVEVEELNNLCCGIDTARYYSMAKGENTTIEKGELTIRASVKVEFLVID